jgi:hypothetical protein
LAYGASEGSLRVPEVWDQEVEAQLGLVLIVFLVNGGLEDLDIVLLDVAHDLIRSWSVWMGYSTNL